MINGKIFGIRIMEESLVQSNPKKYLEGGECCLDDTDTSFCDSSSDDSPKNCYKDIQDEFSTEWVPDSLEDQGSPNVIGRGQEEEDEQTERILQLINAVNHGGESFHIENINKGGEVCSFNCSKENNEPPKLASEPNSNGKVVLNYGSGCENDNSKFGPNIENEGVLGAGKFGPDYVLGGYDNACKGEPSFGIGGIEKDRFLSYGGEAGLCTIGLNGPNYTHNSENNFQFGGPAEANEIQSPTLPLDSNMNGTTDLEAAGDERTSNLQPNQQMVHFEKELVDREEGVEGVNCSINNKLESGTAETESFSEDETQRGSHEDEAQSMLSRRSKKKKMKHKKKKQNKVRRQHDLIAWKEFWIDLGGKGEGQSFHEARAKSIDRIAQCSEALQDVPDMSNNQITPVASAVSCNSNTRSISLISLDERRAEAEDLWKIGKDLGVSGKGNADEILERMIDMEVRDTTDKRRRRRDTNNDK
ncbi:hypothetical protein RIF29_17023 [Crotalaria pallida]|uniref:Uncharacterized protein n=1 Tax=Crotalaria pallida TaxID=3830 RepID=A0AAN9FG95_CROPI